MDGFLSVRGQQMRKIMEAGVGFRCRAFEDVSCGYARVTTNRRLMEEVGKSFNRWFD